MSLTARLLVFFLGTLALVLAGFSATLYLLTRDYLDRQADERLEAALDTLAAAAEIEADGLGWEPHERRLVLGVESGAEHVRWIVRDDRGRLKDHSRNLVSDEFLTQCTQAIEDHQPARRSVDSEGQPWRIAQRQLQADTFRAAPVADSPQPHGPDSQDKKYRVLFLTAALSLQPVETALRDLLGLLAGLSLVLWLLAAFVGRTLCRRALRPMTRMAATARAMTAEDLGQRLPHAGTHDELEDLGRAFNDLLSRRDESFERQRRFTGDASHQLRTPLTAMLGQIEVSLRRDRSAEEYQQVLTLVQRQAGHLRRIVEMLLFLARADAEAKLPHLEEIDLAVWLTDHLQTWSSHARKDDLRLECLGKRPLQAKAQAPLLGQLLDNLLENACKYSAPGTPITIRLGEEAGQVCLTVEDAGSGIPREDLPHVFEPFFRSPEARRQGKAGIGLGLSVAQRIADAFGGALHAESEPGHGTRLTLRLPRTKPE